jgi:hypothetical protein
LSERELRALKKDEKGQGREEKISPSGNFTLYWNKGKMWDEIKRLG